MEIFLKLGSGSKYYEKLDEYVTESGLIFDFTKEMTISDFEEILGENTTLVAECNFNSLKNRRVGERKAVIDGEDFEGNLVRYDGLHEYWKDSSAEWIYCITYNGHIVKIGMTITSLEDRYRSYLCGSRKAMDKGSCSTTNFVINETNYAALLSDVKVEIHAIRLDKVKSEVTRFGVTKEINMSVARDYEEMVTDLFVEYSGHIPVLCVQKGDSISKI
jgi:hypothetical protein